MIRTVRAKISKRGTLMRAIQYTGFNADEVVRFAPGTQVKRDHFGEHLMVPNIVIPSYHRVQPRGWVVEEEASEPKVFATYGGTQFSTFFELTPGGTLYTPEKRRMSAFVYGDIAEDMEKQVLESARAFFGEEAVLELDRSYAPIKSSGKTEEKGLYFCSIHVRVVG
jgi:hypothetical protein